MYLFVEVTSPRATVESLRTLIQNAYMDGRAKVELYNELGVNLTQATAILESILQEWQDETSNLAFMDDNLVIWFERLVTKFPTLKPEADKILQFVPDGYIKEKKPLPNERKWTRLQIAQANLGHWSPDEDATLPKD